MTELTRKEKIEMLNTMGEEQVFERICGGEAVTAMITSLNVGYRLFSRWLNEEEGRLQRYKAGLEEAGHFYAARALDTAQAATSENVNVARLKVDTDKWMAAKLNQQYDVRQRDVEINISVTDLHAQAAQLIASVEDAEIVEGD